jgi:hypothetical protein
MAVFLECFVQDALRNSKNAWSASHKCFGDGRFVSPLWCSGLESALFPALTGWVNLRRRRPEGSLFDRLRAAALLPHFLVVGTGRGDYEFLGGGVQNCLLHVVGPIGQTSHLNLQRNGILFLAHVGVDAQGDDFRSRRIESKGHLIAGLRIVLENQIREPTLGIQESIAGPIGLLHFLRVGGNVLAE